LADADEVFFGNAIQYYAAGRYAFFAGLNYVAANLLHHAVEMCLKGALSRRGKSLPELEKLQHKLPKIWEAFKVDADDASLDSFDGEVSALHAYEKLRYPDTLLKEGMLSGFSLRKPTSPADSGWRGKEPEYVLCLEAVDEIVGAIFKAANINPKFFTAGLREEAKQYLTRENVWLVTV
jgi:HEPN domain-containing protein